MRKFTKYPSNYVGAASETSGAAVRKQRRAGKEGAKLLATDGEWELWTPETFEASIYLAGEGGKKAYWDTAYEGNGPRYFDYYTEKGPLYIFINKNNPEEKYQYHEETNSFYDFKDHRADFDSFICEHPAFADYFGVACDDVEACGDIHASQDIEAKRVISKYDAIRDLLGEDEWYYLEDYIMNGDSGHSFDDVLYEKAAWDDYVDWKKKTYGLKTNIKSSTRIKAARYLRGF